MKPKPAANSELEQTCIRFGRLVARESGVRFVDLFTGDAAIGARLEVWRRVVKQRPRLEEREVLDAIGEALSNGDPA